MEVMANGKPVHLAEGASVADLLDHLNLGARVVVVERNGDPIDRRAISTVMLSEGDRLEIVRAVAGG
jgi:sulfur carrier protein